jgi:uncharacterized protein
MEALMAGVAVLWLGPLLYLGAHRSRKASVALHACIVASIVALVAIEVLPHCVEVAGWWALAVGMAGLLGPPALEQRIHRVASPSQAAMWALGAAALAFHGALDGMMISQAVHGGAGAAAHAHDALLPAILLHRLPEGAALWWLVRPYGRRAAVGALGLESVATLAGFGGAALLAPHVPAVAAALAEAFVAGLLLHVVFHRRPTGDIKAQQAWASPARHGGGSGA